MKKTILFLGGVFAFTSWLGCSHSTSKSESISSRENKPEYIRKLAGLMDAGIVGPNGEVILFYKEGDKIIIQRCEDYTVLNSRGDCKTRPLSSVAQVPVNQFKNRLKAALSVPGDYTAPMKKKIDFYNENSKSKDSADFERQRLEVEKSIKQIQYFIKRYGNGNVNLGEKERLERKFGIIKEKISRDPELAEAIGEINQLIDKLVDQIIGNSTFQEFVFSRDKQSFEFNILRSYIKVPGILAEFANVRAGTFQMGSPSSEKGRYDDEDVYSVTLTKNFEIQQTEVTQAQWFLVMGYNPSYFKNKENCSKDYLEINGTGLCPNHPVF